MLLEKAKIEIKDHRFKDIFEEKDGIYNFKTYIAGKWVDSEDKVLVKSPIDGSIIASVPKLDKKIIDNALDIISSKGKWSIRDLPGEKRLRVFHRVADILEELKEEFADVLVVGNGKTKSAAIGEINASIERLRRSDLDVRKLYGEYIPGDWSTESLESEAIVRREPLGVVLAITPFNYPLFDAINKLVYSSVAGNAIVLKPSTLTPLPAILLARILEISGFPKESLAVFTVPGSEMKEIVKDSRINVISFTGSSETGKEVIKSGGIKSYIMELGGGDPVIVLDDAEPQFTASKIVTGITAYAGQRCDAIKLILSEPKIYDDLKSNLINEIKKIKVGDPRSPETNMGPLIEEKTAEEFELAIKDAISMGGKVLYGGKRIYGNYVEPTIIEISKEKVKNTYLYHKEVFAPIALLVEVENFEEAIKLSNDRRYGLDAAIFGNNMYKIRKIIRYLDVGAIYINEYPRHGIGYFPFGGRKDSGIGKEGIGYPIEYVTGYKTIVYNYKGKGIWEYL
ncbi:MAG: NADP-dependent glyceraldehyde-3-phosphate dehydrogenase [Sulfolobaceae archaeon]